MEIINIIPEYVSEKERKIIIQNQYYELQEILYNRRKKQESPDDEDNRY